MNTKETQANDAGKKAHMEHNQLATKEWEKQTYVHTRKVRLTTQETKEN